MHCSSQVKTTPAPVARPLALGLLTLAMLGGRLCIPGTQEFVTIPFLNVKTMKEGRKEGVREQRGERCLTQLPLKSQIHLLCYQEIPCSNEWLSCVNLKVSTSAEDMLSCIPLYTSTYIQSIWIGAVCFQLCWLRHSQVESLERKDPHVRRYHKSVLNT